MEKKKFIPKQSKDRLTVEYDRDDFEGALPHLARELRGESTGDTPFEPLSIPLDGVEHPVPDPEVEDFIRRCSTNKEALDIIAFMETSEQITPKKADNLRQQLLEKGLRSFGYKKTWGYYEREYRLKKMKR